VILKKGEIRERLRVKSVWLKTDRTPFFTATEEHMTTDTLGNPALVQRYIRYIVSLLFQGNAIQAQSVKVEKYREDGTYEVKWSDLQIQPAAMPQIPVGAYDIEDPIISLEGGTNLYGKVSGNSINLTVTYWDNEL